MRTSDCSSHSRSNSTTCTSTQAVSRGSTSSRLKNSKEPYLTTKTKISLKRNNNNWPMTNLKCNTVSTQLCKTFPTQLMQLIKTLKTLRSSWSLWMIDFRKSNFNNLSHPSSIKENRTTISAGKKERGSLTRVWMAQFQSSRRAFSKLWTAIT